MQTARLLTDINQHGLAHCQDVGPKSKQCAIGRADRVPTVFIWGDSHGEAFGPGLDAAAKATNHDGILEFSQGCPPLISVDRLGQSADCAASSSRILEEIRKSTAIREVVLTAHWNEYLYNGDGIFALHESHRIVDALLFEAQLNETLKAISAPGRRITLLVDMPNYEWDVPKMIYATSRIGIPPRTPPDIAFFDVHNKMLITIFQKTSARYNTRIVSLGPEICNPICNYLFSGRTAFIDDHHVSNFASQYQYGPIFARKLF